MALKKLAKELQETIRQTREMSDDMQGVLTTLTDINLLDVEARNLAIDRMVVGLQAQDRIEQRCTNIQSAIDQMIARGLRIDDKLFADIWQDLSLDELSKPELFGAPRQQAHGEVDLF